jgi:hypothetical protein
MNRIVTSLALLAAVGTLAGCSKEETVSSENIKTAGIAALIEVKAENENSSTVRVELLVGGDESNTHVILDNGDKLSVAANGENKTLSAESEGIYTANIGTGAADTEFVIGLERPDDTAAPNSSGKLPPPFTVGNIDAKSRATDAVDITWDPSGSDSIVIDVLGDCIKEKKDIKTSDTGSYSIGAGELVSGFDSDKDKTCDVTVRVWRERGGSADSAYDNESRMVMRQVRSVKFQAAP